MCYMVWYLYSKGKGGWEIKKPVVVATMNTNFSKPSRLCAKWFPSCIVREEGMGN